MKDNRVPLILEEKITYKQCEITRDAAGFWVHIPDLFSGQIHQETLEGAQKYIDYVLNNLHKWH